MKIINSVVQEMLIHDAGNPQRIQHFIKVHSFAKLIGELENLDESTQKILEITSIVHDIGIKIAEEKYGNSNGKLQEQEGPSVTKQLLTKLGLDSETISRVCYLVGHHHTYSNVDGMDYQILIEADFLVNLFENKADKKSAISVYEKIFKTESGKRICKSMFSL